MIKALFITHDVSGIYGASRSLQALLCNYNNRDIKIDLAVNKKFIGHNSLTRISRLFKVDSGAIFEFYLPFSFCWVGKSRAPLPVVLKNTLSVLTRKSLEKFIKREKYDVVYLNSLVLHSLINKHDNYIIHVREIFDHSDSTVIQNLKQAKGIIFIDQSTSDVFRNEYFKNKIILNNPFDMRNVKDASANVLLLNEQRTVISMVGQIHEGKGTLFIIQTFLKSDMNRDAILLIVGGGNPNYIAACKKEAEGKSNIIFFGEEPEIEKIYKVSDYIIRGESLPCIGRTIYEGLYSGCHVIIPGDVMDNALGIDDEFAKLVHFYEPRNSEDLKKVFADCIGRKVKDREYKSNVEDYVKKFHSFLVKCITPSSN
jgi:hypothetical protein